MGAVEFYLKCIFPMRDVNMYSALSYTRFIHYLFNHIVLSKYMNTLQIFFGNSFSRCTKPQYTSLTIVTCILNHLKPTSVFIQAESLVDINDDQCSTSQSVKCILYDIQLPKSFYSDLVYIIIGISHICQNILVDL